MCVIDTLFAVFEDGIILKADTCTNPCTVQAEWPCDNLQSKLLSNNNNLQLCGIRLLLLRFHLLCQSTVNNKYSISIAARVSFCIK